MSFPFGLGGAVQRARTDRELTSVSSSSTAPSGTISSVRASTWFQFKCRIIQGQKYILKDTFKPDWRVTHALLRKLDKCKVSFFPVKKSLSVVVNFSFFCFHHQSTLLFLCLTLLCCPSHSLSTSSVASLWPFTLSVPLLSLNLLLPWIISSSFPPSHVVFSSPPSLAPLSHLLVFCCVSSSAGVH